MKTIAAIQFFIALISAVAASTPTLIIFLASIGGIFSLSPVAVLAPLTAAMWWYGSKLIIGYADIQAGRLSLRETVTVWKSSLAFNLVGLAIGAALLVNEPSAWLNLGWLFPVCSGTILAFVALLIQGCKRHSKPSPEARFETILHSSRDSS
jgi:hypothetical protein